VAVFRTIPAGDLAIENGDLLVLGYTDETRVRYIRQKIASRFKFFLREWFLDQREGVPYYRDVFVKNPNLDLVRSLFRRVLLKTTGVKSVTRFVLNYDPAARTLSFAFSALVDGGEVAVRPEDADFIVSVAAAR
jgi:hypothetical protein